MTTSGRAPSNGATASSERRAKLSVLAGAVLWGTTGTARALGAKHADPVTIGAARIAVGGLVLCLLAGRKLAMLRRVPRAALVIAALGMAGYQVCFFVAVQRTGVGVGTVVALGSAPAFTGVLALVLDRERQSARWLVSTGLAVLGCVLLGLAGSGAHVDTVGVVLALVTGLAYAAVTVAGKRVLASGAAHEAVMAGIIGLGAIVLLPVYVVRSTSWVGEWRPWVAIAWLGVGPTALGYLLFARGLHRLSGPVVTTLTLAEPVVALVLATTVLSERPGVAALVGIGLVLAGLVVLATGGSVPAVPEGEPLDALPFPPS